MPKKQKKKCRKCPWCGSDGECDCPKYETRTKSKQKSAKKEYCHDKRCHHSGSCLSPIEKWEKEFDKKWNFLQVDNDPDYQFRWGGKELLKQFIRNLITEARKKAKQQTLQEIEEWVENRACSIANCVNLKEAMESVRYLLGKSPTAYISPTANIILGAIRELQDLQAKLKSMR